MSHLHNVSLKFNSNAISNNNIDDLNAASNRNSVEPVIKTESASSTDYIAKENNGSVAYENIQNNLNPSNMKTEKIAVCKNCQIAFKNNTKEIDEQEVNTIRHKNHTFNIKNKGCLNID